MITENLSTLKIHNLTKEQYERELAAGRIDENALYLTPYEEDDLSEYATQEYVDEKISLIPTPDVSDQINEHNTNETAHSDIRLSISEAIDNFTTQIRDAGSIDIELEGSNEGETNPINADTLGGFSINDLVKKTEMPVPPVSDSDNGKFLKVVDGTPTWETVPSAEEVSF